MIDVFDPVKIKILEILANKAQGFHDFPFLKPVRVPDFRRIVILSLNKLSYGRHWERY
jgi:hypothetical protein